MFRFTKSRARCCEQGYILLTLMLFASLLVIAAAAVLPEIAFQVKRDREEELIHRGVQYSRAVRKYVKKFGRYPTNLESLENTNQLRFLRKRYKDPVTGKDFKLLHLGEVQATFGPGIAGAASASALAGPLNANQANLNANPANQPNNAAFARASNTGPSNTGPTAQGTQQQGTQGTSGEDVVGPDQAKAAQQGQFGNGDALAGQVFGGGPIVGVASTSKVKTIREFNKKNHYDQWQFIYDPSTDRGGLLNSPSQPPLQGTGGVVPGAGGAPGVPGQPAQPAQPAPNVQPLQQPPAGSPPQ